MNKHRHGGSPLPKEAVISFAAVASHDLDDAKNTFDILRKSRDYPFVMNQGKDAVLLDNSYFPELVDFVRRECGWSPMKINNMLRHYDVFEHHTF